MTLKLVNVRYYTLYTAIPILLTGSTRLPSQTRFYAKICVLISLTFCFSHIVARKSFVSHTSAEKISTIICSNLWRFLSVLVSYIL